MKNSTSINLVYIEDVDMNEMELILILIMENFKNWVNNFVTKDRVIYEIKYNSV